MSDSYYYSAIAKARQKRTRRNLTKARAKAEAAGRLYSPKPTTLRAARQRALKPFVGVDGEGGGRDRHGRQPYRLMRAGDKLLFNRNRPLSSVQCLNFILSLPRNRIYVGFAFGYDSTMILRDLPEEYVVKLFDEERQGYTYWQDFAIDYRPGHYLRVARLYGHINKPIPNSSRTIYETWGFFQSSFVATLDRWAIGDKTARAKMEATKKRRGQFVRMTPKIIAYNAQECTWLAELMETFRERSLQCDLAPKTWNGPGKTASLLLSRHKVIRSEMVKELLPAEVYDAAQYAYYGGRAELVWVGAVENCWYYDINSAYPAAMLNVPCIAHGTWRKVGRSELSLLTEADLFLADVAYNHPKDQTWCGLPHRADAGGLTWRRRGAGTYWSMEIFAAIRAGARVQWNHGWLYERHCSCQPLAFVEDIYRQRKALDRIAPNLGVPLKLAINSLYGKFAQRIGKAPWQNHLWAGFITASCRAKVLDAVSQQADPSNGIMIATDGVFSHVPLPLLDIGDELGNWGETELGPVLFVKPGIYWQLAGDGGLVKARGMPIAQVRTHKRTVEAAWHAFSERIRREPELPSVSFRGLRQVPHPYPVLNLPISSFTGLRLAHARGKPLTAGSWSTGEAAKRRLGFAWGTKRVDWVIRDSVDGAAGLAVLTIPYPEAGRSAPWHDGPTLQSREADMERWEAEGQPDYTDLDDQLGEA
jgi:hypothetical protein